MTNKYDALKNSDDIDSGEDGENGSRDQCADKIAQLPPLEIPPLHHKLQYQYWLWFSKRNPGKAYQPYDQNLKLIGQFGSVEQFWALYCHLMRPSEFSSHCDFHLFKTGIKPMWEDKANKNGGKWIVRLRKGLASRCWENLILAMLGEQFMVGEEICGAVVSIRYQEDSISVWNKTATDQATRNRIGETLKRVLNSPPNLQLDYKSHNDSLKGWTRVPQNAAAVPKI
ncbi:eukaryotic translation initiation factor 4E type 2-like [Macrosteles quadrilineatus]|uniref:eukaryotic translation initiation factor 4E type 2-like n=1 Tax=Macrosteles quadrilineatus TaxID=74068 RepID=UPI0023E18D95|nr:eukaryotic translation initiation factor 4E type 2-like [Macrosteles quadrilineatus]XP_054268173.1 eukaryotic translation initiation factor 4E type 2-like [Macrosteles quadrilineatus]